MNNFFLIQAALILTFLTLILNEPAYQIKMPKNGNRPASTCWFRDTTPPVRLEVERKEIKDMQILFIKDTALNTESISLVLGKGYGEIMQLIQANKLIPLRFMAWYATTQSPWIMDIAVETSQIPENLNGRIQSRVQKGGEALVVHMWGPYDQAGKAYSQIQDWLKDNNRTAGDPPFEVYLNDPNMVKSPMEIRTDIYQPLK